MELWRHTFRTLCENFRGKFNFANILGNHNTRKRRWLNVCWEKNALRKMVDCFRRFAGLREALEGGRALDEAKDFKRSRPRSPSTASPRSSIPVRGQRSRNWRDCKGEAAKNSTCQNEAEGGQRRPSTNRALFSDQFSELDDEITSPVMYLPPIEMLWLPLVWRSVALCIIQSA